MVRKECRFGKKGDECRCKDGLKEVTGAQEALCKCLLQVQFGWDGFKRVPNSDRATSKTWLCEEHWPEGLEMGDLLGQRVAQEIGGELLSLLARWWRSAALLTRHDI